MTYSPPLAGRNTGQPKSPVVINPTELTAPSDRPKHPVSTAANRAVRMAPRRGHTLIGPSVGLLSGHLEPGCHAADGESHESLERGTFWGVGREGTEAREAADLELRERV